MAQIEGMHGKRDRADTLTERHSTRAARPAQAFKKIYVQKQREVLHCGSYGRQTFPVSVESLSRIHPADETSGEVMEADRRTDPPAGD